MTTINEAWETYESISLPARQLMANGQVWYLPGEEIILKYAARPVTRIEVAVNTASGAVLVRLTEIDGRGFKIRFMSFINTPVTIIW